MSLETEQIKERLDIAEVVGEYVILKQAGQHFKGLCPFHQEKTPSFIVSPGRGIWHCFGCGEGGDVFSFVQKIEGLDFPAALKMLADRAGVELQSQPAPAVSDRRTHLYEILQLAAHFYHEILMRQPAGHKALNYLAERGLAVETLKRFGVGYALQNWDALSKYLARKGYREDDIVATGLAGRSQRGKVYDRFRGRIMFPVEDIQGRVIAFGGRITPWHATGEEGKYINSPETEIYEKRRVVYNLNRAKKVLRRHEPCLVVEGYMDIAMLVQAGIENVVATSGTAFTADHIVLLKRYTDILHFAFDGDAAGLHAAQAATAAAVTAGLRVATVFFPEGQDPADVALKAPEKLHGYLSRPVPLVEVLLQQLRESSQSRDREEWLRNIMPFLSRVSNVVQQGEMVQAIAATLHVPESTIYAELTRSARGERVRAAAASISSDSAVSILSAERLLLGLTLADPAARQAVFSQLSLDIFATPDGATLWRELKELSRYDNFDTMPGDDLLSLLPEPALPLAEACRALALEIQTKSTRAPQAEAVLLLRGLRRQRLKDRLQYLQRQISENVSEPLLNEFKTLTSELATIDKNR